jgi:hypothetical protein
VSSEAEGGAYESEVTQPSFSSASEDTVEDDQQLHQGKQTYNYLLLCIQLTGATTLLTACNRHAKLACNKECPEATATASTPSA